MTEGAGIRVLHVDDDPEFTDVATEFLERENEQLTVDTAASVDEGLGKLEGAEYDCVVSDYDMPVADGIEFLEGVREAHPDLPFILYTSAGSESVASDAISAGATDYLKKPAGTEQYEVLANRIENAVERYRSRQVLAETRRSLEELAEHADDVLFMSSGDWTDLLFVNSTFEDVFGLPTEAVEDDPLTILEAIHPDDREEVRRSMESVSNGTPESVECRVVQPDGTRRRVYAESKPVLDDGGEVARIAGYVRDVTEQRQYEQDLKRYREFVEQTTDLITLVDETGRIEFNSPAIEDILGYGRRELVGEDPFEYVHPDDLDRIREKFGRVASEPGAVVTAEFRFRHEDGSWVWFESRGRNLLDNPDVDGIVFSQRDITERKERERALERLHESTREFMTATTTEEVATRASETAVEVLGLPMNGIHLYDPETDALEPVAWGGESRELLGGRPPSLPVDASLAGRAYDSGEALTCADVREADGAFDTDTPFRSEHFVPIGTYGVFVFSSTEAEDFSATDEALARLLADDVVTALDRVEQRQQLRRERDRLDEFASIISHDLRNPLNVAVGRLELARSECESEYLDDVARAHERIDALVEDLLSLAREGQRVDETEPVSLAETTTGSWRYVETGDASLATETELTVRADPNRLRQLLENLFRNAVEHAGSDVAVTVGDLPDSQGFYVSDDGPGIPDDERDRVFEAGYSTADESTGFGLNIAREIAEAHGWTIGATDSEAGGARFEVSGVDVVEDRV